MEKDRLFIGLYEDIKKNIVLLLVVVVVAALAGIIFSSPYFMKPRYKSTAVVYPINLTPHSDESETEQMLQMFANEMIKESVLNTFKLYERWELKPNDPEYRHWSDLLYQERVSISPTRYESVEVVCQDEDPEVAKQMCEHIVQKYNEAARKADRDIHQAYLELKQGELYQLNNIMDSLQREMSELRKRSGITDYKSQSERVMEGYMTMLRSGASESRLEQVRSMIDDLAEAGGELEVLGAKIDELKGFYMSLTEGMVMATSKASSNLNYVSIAVEPRVADKKSYPIRWVILVMSVLLGTLAAIILIVFKERLGRKS